MRKTRILPVASQDQVPRAIYWFALKFALMVPLVHAYLKLFGYNRTVKLLKRLIPVNTTSPSFLSNKQEFPVSTFRGLVRQVRIRSPLPGTCLSRSLTLWFQLHRIGIETELFIGTLTDSKTFEAHAWVEYKGYPVNAGNYVRKRYATFERSMLKNL